MSNKFSQWGEFGGAITSLPILALVVMAALLAFVYALYGLVVLAEWISAACC